MPHQAVEKFGRLIVKALRDGAIGFIERAVKGQWKAPSLHRLQSDLASLTPEQREVVRRCLVRAIDTGLHDFLFALVEVNDRDQGVEVIVDGQNVVELSDGLHGEPFVDGWIAKYSQFPESSE